MLTTVGVATPGHAASDIDTVTLSPDGPNKALPLGTDFYLQGDIGGSVEQVYVVLVRTSWPLFDLWSADADRCNSLQKRAPPIKLAEVDRHTTTKALWPDDKKSEPALVIGPWERSGADQRQYKILIPPDSLFRQGASYCLLSYIKQSVTTAETVHFQEQVLALGVKARSCWAQHCGEYARNCGDKAAFKSYGTCVDEAASEMTKAIKSKFADIPKDRTAAAWKEIRTSLANAALVFSLGSAQMTNKTGSWPVPYPHQPDGSLYVVPPPLPTPAKKAHSTDPDPPPPPAPETYGLAFVLADRLAARGELTRLEPGYRFGSGVVKRIGVNADYTFSVEVEQAATAEGSQPTLALLRMEVPASSVLLPDSQLSVEDAWRLAMGAIRVKGEYLDINRLSEGPLAHLALGADLKFTAAQLEDVAAVRAAFEAWDDFFLRMKNLSAGGSHNARALRALGANMAVAANLPTETSQLVTMLREYERSEQAWNGSPKVIRDRTKVNWKGAGSIKVDRHTALTQQRWFDTYFTPVVGRATIHGRSATLAEWYVGVQLFGYANDVNEPMWVNGLDDLRRFVGLELGALTSTDEFGPSHRFSADDDVGLAWMLGLVLQPLPYTTLSLGGTWLSERESRIAAEKPADHLSFYVGLAVQANVPGIIRSIATKSTATASGAK